MHMGQSHTRIYCSCWMHIHIGQSHTLIGLSHTCLLHVAAAVQQLQYTRMGQSHMRMHGTIEQSHAYTMQHGLSHVKMRCFALYPDAIDNS